MLNVARISRTLRPEDLSIEEWCKLANVFGEWKKVNSLRSLGQMPKARKSLLNTELSKPTETKKSFFSDHDLEMIRSSMKNKPGTE